MPQLNAKRTNTLLWIVQALLALLFLFAGSMKFVMPLDAMQGPVALPGFFIRLVGSLEILGALGLVLPGVLHIRPTLTPLAATGLVGIMTGATVLTATTMGVLPSLFPVVVGGLALLIAFGRRGSSRAIQF